MEEFINKSVGLLYSGRRIEGIAGVGGTAVVLHLGKTVVKIPRSNFVFSQQIDEFDLNFTREDGSPAYDVEILNAKLTALVGNPHLDAIVGIYDTLFMEVIDSLTRHSSTDDQFAILNAMGTVTTASVTQRRLRIQEQSDDSEESQNATVALNTLDEIAPQLESPDLEAADLQHNPLLVWAGARAEFFFLEAELQIVREYFNHKFEVTNPMFRQAGGIAAAIMVLGLEEAANRYIEMSACLMSRDNNIKEHQLKEFNKGFEKCGRRLSVGS